MSFPIILKFDLTRTRLLVFPNPHPSTNFDNFTKELQNNLNLINQAVKDRFHLESHASSLNTHLIEVANKESSEIFTTDSLSDIVKARCMLKLVNYLESHRYKVFPSLLKHTSSEETLLIKKTKNYITTSIETMMLYSTFSTDDAIPSTSRNNPSKRPATSPPPTKSLVKIRKRTSSSDSEVKSDKLPSTSSIDDAIPSTSRNNPSKRPATSPPPTKSFVKIRKRTGSSDSEVKSDKLPSTSLLSQKKIFSNPYELDETIVANFLTQQTYEIFQRKSLDGIAYMKRDYSKIIFECSAFPGLVFKTINFYVEKLDLLVKPTKESIKAKKKVLERYENSEIVRKHLEEKGTYKCLYLPITRVFLTHNNNIAWLVEEKLPIENSNTAYKVWSDQKDKLTLGFTELAQLIQEVHLSDINPKNFPLFLKDDQWMLGLIDIEYLKRTSIKEELENLLAWSFSSQNKQAILQVCPPDFVKDYLENK